MTTRYQQTDVTDVIYKQGLTRPIIMTDTVRPPVAKHHHNYNPNKYQFKNEKPSR